MILNPKLGNREGSHKKVLFLVDSPLKPLAPPFALVVKITLYPLPHHG